MAKQRDIEPVIYLRPGDEPDGEYGHLKFRILVLDHSESRGYPINPGHYSGPGFQDLIISAQMDERSCDSVAMADRYGTALYAYRTNVEGYVIHELRDLEALVRTMRKIERATNESHIARFEDYVTTVGKTIGARYATAEIRGNGYGSYVWRYLTETEARSYIIWEERELRKRILERAGRAA